MDYDFSSLLGNAESLAIIYAWTLLAAGVFALGEKVAAGFAARKAPAQATGADRLGSSAP
jgi:hypothetical protein